jgi:hypothetical protein
VARIARFHGVVEIKRDKMGGEVVFIKEPQDLPRPLASAFTPMAAVFEACGICTHH